VRGPAEAGGGRNWLPVRGPDGLEGWVPEEFTAEPGSVPVVVATAAVEVTEEEAVATEEPVAEEPVATEEPAAPAAAATPTSRPRSTPTAQEAPAAAPNATGGSASQPPAASGASAPCLAGQVKAEINTGEYREPGQAGYDTLHEGVACFDSAAAAEEADYRPAGG
jgi:hypothetical protein